MLGTGFGRPIPIFTLQLLGWSRRDWATTLVLLTLLRRAGSKESDGGGPKSAALEQLGMS